MSGLLSDRVDRVRSYRQQQPVALSSSDARSISDALMTRRDAAAASTALADTGRSNPLAAAEALVAASSQGGGAAFDALADNWRRNPRSASNYLARGADLAVNRGYLDPFSRMIGGAFGVARRRNSVPQMTTAITEAVATGGTNAQVTYGTAIAKAVAAGGDSQAAVAEATATAYCEGGSTAESWSNAYAVAISQDSKGCLVMNEARAMAMAKCGGGQFTSEAKAEATSTVLGFCGLLPWGFRG